MADTITSYEGNANLGAGSNANIASPTDVRLFEGSSQAMSEAFKTINDTHKTIALMNFEFNQKMFAQKVKDRDTLMGMLDAGEATIGNYRKEDKKYLDEAQKDYDEKFDNYSKKGINDRDSMREFKESARKLKDIGTKLQMRYNHEKTEKTLIAAETITAKREARQKALNESFGGDINDPVKEYQQTLDFVLGFNGTTYNPSAWVGGSGGGDVVPRGTTGGTGLPSIGVPSASTSQRVTTTKQVGKPDKTVTTTTPAKEVQQKGVEYIPGDESVNKYGMVTSTSKRYFNADISRRNSTNAFIDPKSQDHEMQSILHDHMQTKDPTLIPSIQSHLEQIVDRVKAYNSDRGFTKGQVGFVPYENISDLAMGDINSGFTIKPSVPDFAWLDALAQVQGSYKTESRAFLADQTKARQEGEKNALDASYKQQELNLKNKAERFKESNESARTGAYVSLAHAKINNMDDKKAGKVIENDYNAEVSSVDFARLGIPFNGISPMFGYDNKGNLSQVKPIGGREITESVPLAAGGTANRVIGYSGGYYDRKYTLTQSSVDKNGRVSVAKKTLGTGGLIDLFKKDAKPYLENKLGRPAYAKDIIDNPEINSAYNKYVKKMMNGDIKGYDGLNITLIGENGREVSKESKSAFLLKERKQTVGNTGATIDSPPVYEPE